MMAYLAMMAPRLVELRSVLKKTRSLYLPCDPTVRLMEKRYQVFVSSTFTDLQDERHGIMQTLMQLDCIPAGMELFPAADEEQWAFIQKVIDDCDYYLLIVGGRYGSTTTEGISFTEKEYDYAVSKGIHVIALLHGDLDQLPLGKSEIEEAARQKLTCFRARVSTGRLVKFWKLPAELLQQSVLSLTHAFKAHPRAGWIRGSEKVHAEVTNELTRLSRENLELRTERKLAEFELVDALITTTDCQFLIWMMESGKEVAGWSSYVYETGTGAGGSGQFDRNEFQAKFTGIGLVRGAGGSRFVAITKLGVEFAKWLVSRGRKCAFFWTPDGGWGEVLPGSNSERWVKEQQQQAERRWQPVLETQDSAAQIEGADPIL